MISTLTSPKIESEVGAVLRPAPSSPLAILSAHGNGQPHAQVIWSTAHRPPITGVLDGADLRPAPSSPLAILNAHGNGQPHAQVIWSTAHRPPITGVLDGVGRRTRCFTGVYGVAGDLLLE